MSSLMPQSLPSTLPDILAQRLMQEHELQQFIVHELMRRKNLEHSSTDAHKFVLDRRHNGPPKLPDSRVNGFPNSVFTGIIGKGVGLPVDEHGTDINGNLFFANTKASVALRTQRNHKVDSHGKIRRDWLPDTLLGEKNVAPVSLVSEKKMISPRRERENHNIVSSPRRHVLKLNLGTMMQSQVLEHHSLTSCQGSFSERHKGSERIQRSKGDSSRFGYSFTSARSTNSKDNTFMDQLDLKPPSFDCCSEISSKPCGISETPLSQTVTSGFSQPQLPLRRAPDNSDSSTRKLPRSKASVPQIHHMLGSSAPPSFLRKVLNLRSVLANPVSCHVPNTPEYPFNQIHSQTQSSANIDSKGGGEDWKTLITKYDSRILKPTIKMPVHQC